MITTKFTTLMHNINEATIVMEGKVKIHLFPYIYF